MSLEPRNIVFTTVDDGVTLTQNPQGKWVESVPLPFQGRRKICSCGKKFWTMDGYHGHYAYAHILGMS